MLDNWFESLAMLVQDTGQLKAAYNTTSVKHRNTVLD